MNSEVVKAMTNLKSKNYFHLRNQQITYIPTIEDDQIDYMCQDYLIDGQRHIVKEAFRRDPQDENSRYAFEVCFKLRYLKHRFMDPRKANRYTTGIWKMRDLVENEVICPFALFINGRFIPWECMSIAIGKENYYLLANNGEWGEEFDDVLKNVKFAQIVSLPSHFKYDVGPRDVFLDNFALSFNIDGYYNGTYADKVLGNNESYYRFYTDPETNHISFKRYDKDSGLTYTADKIEFDDIDMRRLQIAGDNVLLFSDGLFAGGHRKNIVKAYDSEHRDEATKKVTPCLEFVTDNNINPIDHFVISTDSNMVTVDYMENKVYTGVTTEVEYTVFINYHNTPNVNNDALPELGYYEETLRNGEKNYHDMLSSDFGNDPYSGGSSCSMLIWKTDVPGDNPRLVGYDENLKDFLIGILRYNTSLLNDAIASTSNLKIEQHTGAWLKSITGKDGIAVIPRRHNIMCDEHILILVNGELYKLYYTCTEHANKYSIPVQDIEDDDVIEFLRFQNVNNLTGSLVLNKDDEYINYSTDVINDEMILFSTETDKDYFDFPEDGLQHFPVDYRILKDEKGYTKVELEDEFYYGKKLTVAYKNRYRHFTYILKGTTSQYTVNLGNKFMYCNDYSKFLVFYNGRRLGSDQYRLTLPVRPTTPFSKFDIYLTLPIVDGDRLDIIYVPSLMKDIFMEYTLDDSGNIIIDKDLLNYDLSKDLFMVWINGCKIPKSNIRDINTTQIAVTHNFKSVNTVCVTKYIPDIEEITEAMDIVFDSGNTGSLWDNITESYLNSEDEANLHKLLGITVDEFDKSEESIYANAVPIRSIMYELIREQYVMNPRVDTTNAFIYDYQDVDTTAIDGRDSEENAILPVVDGNMEDNLDGVDRIWP